jgi:LPS sulfotransferase NodH
MRPPVPRSANGATRSGNEPNLWNEKSLVTWDYYSDKHSNNRRQLFIVFGNQRTGSTLIASRLNSHGRIVCYEELFLPWVDSEPSLRGWLSANGRPQWLRTVPGTRTSFLASLFDAEYLSGEVNAIGFKVMYNQMSLLPKLAYYIPPAGRLFEDPVFRRWLHTNRVFVIHTLRRNHLKMLASHKLATTSGRFHSRDAEATDNQIFLSLRGLVARLIRIEAAERIAKNVIRNLPSIEIYYEDYVSSQGNVYDIRLCHALGQSIPPNGLTSSLTKVSSDDLRDTVKNYEQVAAHLKGTRFERFLV